ncbi:MAG: AraC family transcriptional regulator, partial [Cellvibrionaceae bacterium]|nr:AraC family transcriptional regulator [Cellvibrionaceae bacterium]
MVEFEPTLSSHFIIYLRNYLLDINFDKQQIERFTCAARNSQEDTPVPLSTVAELYNEVAELTDCDYLGCEIGTRYHYESAGMVILMMLAAPSVEKGLQALMRYDPFFDTAIDIEMDIGKYDSSFSANIINPKQVWVEHICDYLMVFIAAALNTASRKPMPCKEVWLAYPSNKSAAPLEKIFNCPVKFGQSCNRIVFSSSYLREKFYSSNSYLFDLLSREVSRHASGENGAQYFINALCREIVNQYKSQAPTVESVAAKLNMSGRTLRRRLAEQGSNFQAVKNQAREQQARYYLSHTNMNLSAIALELGFSELSAFSRAFRSWT